MGKWLCALQDHIAEIGMQSMIVDVDRSRIKLQNKYLQAESAAEDLFSEANAVKKKILELSSRPQHNFVSMGESSMDLGVDGAMVEDSTSSTEDVSRV